MYISNNKVLAWLVFNPCIFIIRVTGLLSLFNDYRRNAIACKSKDNQNYFHHHLAEIK